MLLGSLNRDEGRDVETGVASPAAVGESTCTGGGLGGEG